jgi:hypothetical protein
LACPNFLPLLFNIYVIPIIFLFLHELKYPESAIEAQYGGCIVFAGLIGRVLYDNNITDFEYGQYITYADEIEHMTHMYVIYDNKIFDSVCFGKKNTDLIEDNFADVDGDRKYHIKMPGYNFDTNYDSELVYLNEILEDINIYGVDFLERVYAV